MKILVLSPYLPYPINRGTHRRVYAFIKALSSQFDVEIIAFSHGEGEDQYIEELEEKLNILITLIPIHLKPWRRIKHRLLDLKPDNYARWYDSNIAQAICQRIENNDYHYIHCIDNCMTQYCLPVMKRMDVVTDHSRIDSEYQLEKLQYIRGLKNITSALEVLLKTRWYEKKLHRHFSNHIVCSDEDAQYLYSHLGLNSNVLTIVNGFDCESFQRSKRESQQDHKTLLFTGAMDYQPNIDAMLWFCKDIFPDILKKNPTSILNIVGINPVDEIKVLASDNIIVTGGVEDIAPYYRDCDLYICPLRIGGGSRLKLVEAMAMQCPILTTHIAAQGLVLENDKHVIFADNESEMTEACNTILNNDSKLNMLANNGYVHAHQCYEWGVLLKPLLHYYEDNCRLV